MVSGPCRNRNIRNYLILGSFKIDICSERRKINTKISLGKCEKREGEREEQVTDCTWHHQAAVRVWLRSLWAVECAD